MRRATVIVAVVGVAIFALSFLNGWIVHDREVRGEGYRHSEILLSAWRSVAVPVLSIAPIVAIGTSTAAIVMLARPGLLPRWLLVAGSATVVGIVASSLVPLSWNGHTTSIDLGPGYLTAIGLALAIAMLVASIVAAEVGPRASVVAAVVGVVVAGIAVGGRWTVLEVSGPTNQRWEDGTYVRTGDAGGLALSIEDGAYRIGDRWAGTWESSGGTVVLDNDPACPGSRGAYHAHGEGPDDADLRFVKVVDTCADGERARDLEAGIWERQP